LLRGQEILGTRRYIKVMQFVFEFYSREPEPMIEDIQRVVGAIPNVIRMRAWAAALMSSFK
jgi:hypothetical protein